MVPPTARHVARQKKALSRFVRCLPQQEGFQNAPLKSPLRIPLSSVNRNFEGSLRH